MNTKKLIKKLWPFLKPSRISLFLALSLFVIYSLGNISSGYLNGRAVNAITDMEIKNAIIWLVIYFLFSVIFTNLIYRLAMFICRRIEIKLSTTLSNSLIAKTLDLPATAFEKRTSGEFINRITNDTSVLNYSFNQLLNMLVSIFGSSIILVYIFINSYIVGLFIIVIIVIMGLVVKYMNPLIRKNNEERKQIGDTFTSNINQNIFGMREIKSLGIKEIIFKRSNKIVEQFKTKNEEDLVLHTKYMLIMRFLVAIMEVGTFIICAILIYYDKSDITFFVAMTYYVYRFTWIIESFADLSSTFQKLKVSLTRIFEIIDNELFNDETFGNLVYNPKECVLSFKDVTFGYEENNAILNKLNVTFNPNQKIAIVGKSGHGKSTIFNLATKINSCPDGKIFINDVDINEISENSLRNIISIIRQEPFLFNVSIKENFKIINPKITLKEIRDYCKKAYIDDYIMSLDKKYDTIVGEGGINFSGGQKQRLAIARVLAKKSKIILFDEATSALDNESQKYIKDTINFLVKDHTVIVIAHRLSTISDSDVIHVVEKGQITASGNHEELLEKSSFYKKLYESET